MSLCPACDARNATLPFALRELIDLLSNPIVPDYRVRIDTVRGAEYAAGLLLRAIAEFHGEEQACLMLIALGERVLSPPKRLLKRFEREDWLCKYDLMPGEQSARACAKELAKKHGIDWESARRELLRLIARRKKRDGDIHEILRAELEEMRAELKKRASK
jgi:hypothetical protein